jgi:hypothetical protein
VAGLDWGLPYNWHPDEKVSTASAMVERHTADPDYFVNPSLHLYLVWGVTHIAYAAHPGTYVPMSMGLNLESTRRAPAPNRAVTFFAYRLARMLSVVFSVMTVWLLWWLGRASYGPAAGLLAAAFLSVTMGLANFAHFATPEAVLFFLVLAALGAIEAVGVNPAPRRYVVAGLVIGLACSTKYTAWPLALPLVAAHVSGRKTFLDRDGSRDSLYRWTWPLALAGLAAIAGFVIATPYSVLSARRFLEDLWFNWITGAPQGSLAGQRRSWGVYLLTLANGLGWPLFLAAAAGAARLWTARHQLAPRGRASLLVHTVWILSFWGFYGISPHHALRFIMPIVPSLLLLGAAGVVSAARDAVPVARRAIVCAVGLVLVYSCAYTAMAVRKFLQDPRYAAGTWLNDRVGSDTTVGYFAPDPYLPYFSRPAFRLQFLDVMARSPLKGRDFERQIEDIVATGPDVIVDASFYFDRFVGAPDRFPERADAYARLLAGRGAGTFRPAARFAVHGPWWLDPIPELVAPEIVVFARASTRWR